jgi:hypothetical protein
MNDEARDKLCELLTQQGPSLLTLGRTCEMLIAQSCAAYPAEAKALIQVEKQGIAQEIVNAPDEPSREKMAESWIQCLVDKGNLNDPEARWALNAWRAALKGHSPRQNQTQVGPAWSEANFEAATRTPEQRQQQAPAGARVGILTGFLVGWFFCYIEALAGSHGIGQIWLALIGLPLIGMTLGGFIGWRVGPRIGILHRELTGAIVGALLGILGGAFYFRVFAVFLSDLDSPGFDLVARLATGIFIGMMSGAGIGFFHQAIIQLYRRRRYDWISRRGYYVSQEYQEAEDELNRRMGI